ncbi:cytochrome C551 [Lysinibacillus sphaericus]|uniref:c-type cytochrome n=1 Tax=Lysinibacillus sphaericus TaxID=1421 RepID=UPI0018CEEC6A|nr:cytochrome c [Lysinibacillus sphaericus]MBG9454132.1 cytochrome C551 [Lysinibacillus sphaericus]MBG9477445.1 cytochrome C551 [Lysinibacillus sphaericus]MBG9593627.1 cytochrome C551 [Lysinibacillus sphaericus]
MKNNPVVPYILILAFGVGLIFFMSLTGADNKKEIAAEKEGGGEKTEATDDGSALVQSCIGCHAADLTGSVGPNLHGLDEARIVDVLTNGIEGTPMTPGMKTEAEAKEIAKYISTLK